MVDNNKIIAIIDPVKDILFDSTLSKQLRLIAIAWLNLRTNTAWFNSKWTRDEFTYQTLPWVKIKIKGNHLSKKTRDIYDIMGYGED
jgi:hypothetical protein